MDVFEVADDSLKRIPFFDVEVFDWMRGYILNERGLYFYRGWADWEILYSCFRSEDLDMLDFFSIFKKWLEYVTDEVIGVVEIADRGGFSYNVNDLGWSRKHWKGRW